MWTPVTLDDLRDKIIAGEKMMTGDLNDFWNSIKIEPVKWQEKEYGDEGGGFWVVGICGQRVIWYNDIEEGFNISFYSHPGSFFEYRCEQDELPITVQKLLNVIQVPTHE